MSKYRSYVDVDDGQTPNVKSEGFQNQRFRISERFQTLSVGSEGSQKKQKTRNNEHGILSMELITIENEIRETYEKLHNLQDARYKLLAGQEKFDTLYFY